MDFFPPNKRTEEYLKQVFLEKELTEIIKLHKAQASQEAKRELQQTLIDDIHDEKAHSEITADIKEFALRNNIPDHEIIIIVSTKKNKKKRQHRLFFFFFFGIFKLYMLL